ncbi:hypothetical protein KRX19_05780 [Cardiobacteriaceae bacterium TAE3-ERU3]|nr:hypothetical protein [Cardiobacteriaceae bacterium TAE3-ERU3]
MKVTPPIYTIPIEMGVMTAEELANMLNLSESTLLDKIRRSPEDYPPRVKNCKAWLFYRPLVHQWFMTQGEYVQPDPQSVLKDFAEADLAPLN